MADNNDGSIIIDTELDNEGFTKGSDKLLDAVKDLTGAVDNLGDNMMKSFGQVIPLLQNIATSAAQVNTAMSEGATQAADANARVAAVEQKVAQAAQQAAQQVEGEAQSMGNLSSKAAAAQTTVSGLEREVNSISTGMQGLSASAEKGFASGGAVLTFDQKLSDMETKISAAREKLEAFGATKIPTDDYQWLTTEIAKASKELESLYDKEAKMKETGVKARSKSWQTLAYDIDLAKQKIAEYTYDKEAMESDGSAFTLGSGTEEYQRMQASLDNCSGSLERNKALIDSEALAQARLNVQAAQEQVIRATTDGQRQAAMANLRTAQQELSNLAAQSSTAGAPKEESTSGWQRFGAVLKGVGSAAVKVAGTLAKISFKAVSAGVKAVTGKLKQFVSQSKSTALSAKGLVKALTSVKTMLKTRIKRMFISAIVNNVKESMSSLAQFSSEFDTSMSNLQNGAKQLASNITVALGSLISAIEPLLSTIINGATKAVECFNALIASISGKSTVTVAKKKMDSYAASTSDAADAAKDLKNQTYGFDQLNKRSSDSSSSSSSGSGADTYEEVPIDSIVPTELSGWFDRIKTAFANGDWTGLGSTIAEGFNMAFSAVDTWINDTLRPKAVAWTKNIANVLNGFVDGLDWGQVGKTIADGINTVFDIVNTFLTTFDFGKLGTGLGNAINGLFKNIDWNLLGTTFANKWNALIDFIFGLVTTIDWGSVGDSLSGFVNGFVENLDLDKAVAGVGAFINGIFTALGRFIQNTDWKGLATKVGNSVNGLFSSIDWKASMKTITDGFNSIVTTLSTLIATIDWYAMGKDLVDGITSLITNIDWKEIGNLLSNAVLGLLDLLLALVGETDWGALIQNILGGIGDLLANIDWGQILAKIGALVVELVVQIPGIIVGALGGIADLLGGLFEGFGLDGIAGFFKGIGDAMANAGTWLKENLVDPVVNWVKNLFGIHSPSTVFAEMGDFLIQGLLNGISAAWTGITEFFSNAISGLTGWLSDAWDGIKTTASNAWNGLKDGVTNIFNGAKDAVVNTASNIKTGLSNAWEATKTAASTAWNNVKTSVSTAFTNTKNAVTTTANNIKSGLSTAWTNIKSTASNTWNNIKSNVSGTFNNLKSNISNTANNIKTAASNAWSNIKSTASSKWSDIKSTISDKWSSLKTTMGNTDWGSIGKNLVSGVKNGISNAWSGLTSWFSSKWDSLVGGVKDFLGIHSPSRVFASIGDYMIQGLQVGMEAEKGTALKTATNIAGSITDSFDEASPELTISENATVAGLDAVASRLSGIAATFQAITAALNSIGGFRTPQIAAGTVVPVKTRIDGNPVSADGSGGLSEFTSNVDERMADISYSLKQLIAIVKALHLDIDIDALTEIITQQQRSKLRNFGGV